MIFDTSVYCTVGFFALQNVNHMYVRKIMRSSEDGVMTVGAHGRHRESGVRWLCTRKADSAFVGLRFVR